MRKIFALLIVAILFSGCHWKLRITNPHLTPRRTYVKPAPKVIIIKKSHKHKKKCYRKHPKSNVFYCK